MQWSVVTLHIACAVVSGRVAHWIVGFYAVGRFQVARCLQDVIFRSCTLRHLVVVQKLDFPGLAQPLCDARCAVVSDHSRCVATPMGKVILSNDSAVRKDETIFAMFCIFGIY